jgi:hypothetical protein
MHRYKILNFKNNTWFKIHIKAKIQIRKYLWLILMYSR